jgi:hypothetical protein
VGVRLLESYERLLYRRLMPFVVRVFSLDVALGSSVGIATRLRVGRPRRSGSGNGRFFSLLNNVQTGSGAHPASSTMGTLGCFSQVLIFLFLVEQLIILF